MRINSICKSVLVAAAVYVLPAVVLASPRADQPSAHTPASNQAALNGTSSLLDEVQDEAISVRNNADQLQALLREPFLSSWQADGDYLDRVREHVNELNKLVSQLRAGEAKDSALQKKVIERITPTAVNLADTTEDALVTLNHNESHVFATDLDGLVTDIYKESRVIEQTVTDFEKYSTAQQGVHQVKHTLGLKGNS